MNRTTAHEFLLAELEEDLRVAHMPRPLDLPELARLAAAIAMLTEAEPPAAALAAGRQRLRAELQRPLPPAASRSWHRAAVGTAAAALAAGLLALGSSAGGYALPGMSFLPWSSADAPGPEAAPQSAGIVDAEIADLLMSGLHMEDDDFSDVSQVRPMLGVNLADVVHTGGELTTLLQQNGVVLEPGELPALDGIDFGEGNEVHIDPDGASVDVVGGAQPSVHIETESATVDVNSADGGSVQVEANGLSMAVTGGSEPSVTFTTDDASLDVQGGTSPSVDIQAGDVGLHVEPGQMPVFEGIDLPETPDIPALPSTPTATVTPEPSASPQATAPTAPATQSPQAGTPVADASATTVGDD